MPEPKLPHFIIIGAMKSATTSLQEQLEQQPGIFMSEPKEPNFFSDEEQYRKGLPWYQSLFLEAPGDALLGEASTHYTKLPTYPLTVQRLHEHLPEARLVYVMRHPVDRLISHYMHEWSMGNLDCEINSAIALCPEMVAYGQYAMQLEPFFKTYGRHAVLPVFFDRLIQEPEIELQRVCQFIGYRAQPQWVSDLKPSNVSSQRLRRLPGEDMLVRSGLATSIRRALIPKSWREWVKTRLIMRQRPHLNPKTLGDLENTFNKDLETLGKWLGHSLTCQNFKQVTKGQTLNWVGDHG
jgi:hypothetical protein